MEQQPSCGCRRKSRIHSEFFTEGDPDIPLSVGGAGARRNNAGLDVCLRKAEVIAESICGVGVQRCQDCACGKVELKCCKNAVSER